ncbi:MAG: 2-oxoacid:ferredoxin oxidoreductase subunit beta [Chlorobi bacterium]|nr:2-oxoacid:ferredoxin oxidoreductase subunit beta [Chlorobiota bacterium]
MTDNTKINVEPLKPKDFSSGLDVRWCPGCGDYSILSQIQKTFAKIGYQKHEPIVISGIGCSSRFPYYLSTYGFHGIHGRAPALASGTTLALPDHPVWVATGDGDLMSIGGNHFIHACRKNMDIKLLLFNNRIYGLTKGQYSPTSEKGKITKTSPYGSIDYPFNPISLALGSNATFVARTVDREPKHMQQIFEKASEHKGTAFIEIFQNCVIFNDGAFDDVSKKDVKDDHMLVLEDGQPMLFGKEKEKGIILDGFEPKAVNLNDGKYTIDDVIVHHEKDESGILAFILAHMTDNPNLPTPVGVFRSIRKQTYGEALQEQIKNVTEEKGKGTLEMLLSEGNIWEVN